MDIEQYKNYYGDDLGAVYSLEQTSFRVWAPSASEVKLCLYKQGDGDCKISTFPLNKDAENGTWFTTCNGDLDGVYYTYIVTVDGKIMETVDPYAKAVGVNGLRSMVIDLDKTNPKDFEKDKGPLLRRYTDAIVCEISVADNTGDVSSNVKYPGKYLGLAETGTTSNEGLPTGLDYLADLGVTHVQLMPCYDFGSVDEADTETEQYNWGYDPVNYNVPEGSYATDPFHGEVRVCEFKQMVQAFHKKGLGVIMDVVYNHTYDVESSCFQKCVPNYYYRTREDGSFSDASACGNEIASERTMVRKYIVDSVCYWAKEYHIDGFRFDLMGVLDLETMRQVYCALKEINPSIIVYGEGWVGGDSVLDAKVRSMKVNLHNIENIGAFSDDIRDGIRGSVFENSDTGFANGKENMETAVRYSVVGASYHPQVDYLKYYYSQGPWTRDPKDVVNYVSCHDNMTLWDKLAVSRPDATEEERLAMNRLCAAIVMTSQGVPFFLTGEEICRTKPVEGEDTPAHNSYNLPLYTNSLKYDRAFQYQSMREYYKGLIAFRKKHAALRLSSAVEVQRRLTFIDVDYANVVAYVLDMEDVEIIVAYNANNYEIELNLPNENEYKVFIEKDKAGNDILNTVAGKMTVAPISATVAIRTK